VDCQWRRGWRSEGLCAVGCDGYGVEIDSRVFVSCSSIVFWVDGMALTEGNAERIPRGICILEVCIEWEYSMFLLLFFSRRVFCWVRWLLCMV